MSSAIRTRLHIGASVVMLTFFCLAGWTVQRIYLSHLQLSHFERLRSGVYTLLAVSELDRSGRLQMPNNLTEPQWVTPDSGLYGQIEFPQQPQPIWRTPSAAQLPALPKLNLATGQWLQQPLQLAGREYLLAAYQVRWVAADTPQVVRFIVYEDTRNLQQQYRQFQQALWGWLAAAALGLLLAQALLLRWGLRPLRQLAGELREIEAGRQRQVSGVYPAEIAPLSRQLNQLVEQEHARQQRYREALGDLAHSLKTPLAILRAEQQSAELARHVREQVARMDHIVQHQLGRAALRGQAALAAPLALRPIAERLIASMEKVHAARALQFSLSCAGELQWPLDEGDAFEVIGNVLDNAGKWAQSQVELRLFAAREQLTIVVSDDGRGFVDTSAPLQRGVRLDERVAGHGIGLAVVADIVQAYGGRIELGRSGLGGASVTLVFPAPVG
ncbi:MULTISPECIES: ATP-binding protein [Chitinibacter]|uniref:ATP-binding protein n=1 Tax=Chitinibacter TaxID=230666 RepID=UPI0006472343|nr:MULTISPECIES: ATP-binding protein [Chitinibacter]